MEHVSDPAGALDGARHVLRPGGRLLVLLPNVSGFQRRAFGTHWVNWHLPYHLWHFNAQTLTRMVERSGFQVRRVRTYSPGEWFLLSIGLRWPRFRGLASNLFVSRALRLAIAPVLRLIDAVGRGDCLMLEAYKT